jgi:uncharacterized repeat protein (TIGR01451 family)
VATISIASLSVDQGIKIKPASSGGTQSPNITVTIKADRWKASPGDTITYTVTYTNKGTGTASNIVVSVPVPSYTTYVSASASSGGAYNSSTKKVSWTIQSLAAGASGTATFKAKVN